jgi:tetratricopeptide (TPR) repeat protein
MLRKRCPSKTFISRTISNAISNEQYAGAIKVLDRYFTCLTDSQKYSFALLLDHSAMRSARHGQVEASTGARAKAHHLRRAELLYRELMHRKYNGVLVRLGMSRVCILRGQYSRAAAFQRQAFRMMKHMPLASRGALGIGSLYEQLGNIQLAKKWYVREYQLCGRYDFGVTLNLFRYYLRQGDAVKSRLFARKTKRLLRKELTKNQYRGLGLRSSKFVKNILKDIRRAYTG